MRKVQKRYIYAGMLAALFFVVTYGIMDINVLISLVLTVVIYLGGVFLFKTKDIRTMDSESVNNYYFYASKCANRAGLIDDAEIKQEVEKITTYTDEIIVSLSQRPKKVEQVFSFFDYYLDITYKILYRYYILVKSENRTLKDKEFMDNAKGYIKTIALAFEKQLANMKEARMLDIESEIRMFEKTSGIKKTDMEVNQGENE